MKVVVELDQKSGFGGGQRMALMSLDFINPVIDHSLDNGKRDCPSAQNNIMKFAYIKFFAQRIFGFVIETAVGSVIP